MLMCQVNRIDGYWRTSDHVGSFLKANQNALLVIVAPGEDYSPNESNDGCSGTGPFLEAVEPRCSCVCATTYFISQAIISAHGPTTATVA